MDANRFMNHQRWHNVRSELLQAMSIGLQVQSIELQGQIIAEMRQAESNRQKDRYLDLLTSEFIFRGNSPLEAFKKAQNEIAIENLGFKATELVDSVLRAYENMPTLYKRNTWQEVKEGFLGVYTKNTFKAKPTPEQESQFIDQLRNEYNILISQYKSEIDRLDRSEIIDDSELRNFFNKSFDEQMTL